MESHTEDLEGDNPFREESLEDNPSSPSLQPTPTIADYGPSPYVNEDSHGFTNLPEAAAGGGSISGDEDKKRARKPSVESIDRPPKDAIKIVDALKTSEGANASYIVYCIVFEFKQVRRRYSDFYSLRQALSMLHPCFIIPPLPPKNSISSYAIAGANPSKAKEDAALVARRRRMLGVFLNRVLAHKVLGTDKTFRRFLDPEVPWNDVLHSPPVTIVPKNSLRAAASDPVDSGLLALFASLPLPASNATLQNPDQRFLDSEAFTAKFSSHLSGSMEKVNRRLMKRWTEAASDWGEMGGGINGFALRMGEAGNGGLEEATEKVGMAVDGGYTSTNFMLQAWEQLFTEPLAEYTQFSAIIKGLLKYRHLKHVQYETTRELLESKRADLEELERSEVEAQRLEKALERVRIATQEGRSEPSSASSPRVESEESTAPIPPLSSSMPSSENAPRRSGGGLLGAITHTFHGMVDVDPESTRRSTITKTRESIKELDEALKALTQDLRYASLTIQADLDRFQRQKVADIREMCLDFARFHREWASKNLVLWEQARDAILSIECD